MNANNSHKSQTSLDSEDMSLANSQGLEAIPQSNDSQAQLTLDCQIPEVSNAETEDKVEVDSVDNRSVSSSEEEEEDEEEQKRLAELLAKKRAVLKTQRSSVSAEAYGKYNPKDLFVPKLIPKDNGTVLKIKAMLLNSFIFQHIEEKELAVIIGSMEERHYPAGSDVIRQGDDGNELYLVGGGQLRCSKRFPEQKEDTFLRTYQSGEYFGELALLYNIPRAASIMAISDSVLYSLDRECFNHIVKDSAIKSRMAFEHFLGEVQLFNTLNHQERSKLCDCLRIQTFDAGQKVIREGETGDTFFMIIEGEAEALKSNPKSGKEELVFEYKPKMYFGELALLRDVPRAASIVAKVR
jgi:cAMP-dependent protein kinase regulator